MSTSDPTSPQESSSTNAPALAEGAKLAGCYGLTRRLLAGGSSEIWEAQDEVLGKDVSLHFLPPGIHKDPQALQELRIDIKRNRQLIHPNILRVYDLVEEADWVAVSMDTFAAEPLSNWISGGAHGRKPEEVRPWAEQLANTLEESHKINVLHGHLTPSDLFLTATGKLVVANFGISRTIREAQLRAGVKDSNGKAYLSPQVLEGQAPTRSDDIYSFGGVLFEALTGNPPGPGVDLSKAGMNIPANWAATVAACLDKNPDARPRTAAEVGRRLLAETTEVAPAVVTAPKSEPAAPARQEIPTAQTDAIETGASASAVAGTAADFPAPKEEPEAPVSRTEQPVKEIKKPADAAKSEVLGTPPASEIPPPKSPDRPIHKETAPSLYQEESRFPVKILAAAAALIVVAVIYGISRKPANNDAPEKVELRALTPSEHPPIAATSTPPESVPSEKAVPVPEVSPKVETTSPANETKVASSATGLEEARMAAQAAENAHAELVQKREMVKASVAEVEKAVEEKSKAIAPLMKASEEAGLQRKKLEDAQKAADAAAVEAQKAAEEKMKLAEEAKAALEAMDKTNQDQLAAQQKAVAEIAALKQSLLDRQKAAEETAKAVAEAEAAKEKQLAAVAARESEIQQAKMAQAEAQKKREADEAERLKVEQELEDMKKMFAEKMRELEEKRKALENPGAVTPPSKPPIVTPTTPPPAATPQAAASDPMKVAKLTATPEPTVVKSVPPADLVGANSLGQKFAPVGVVEFCVWQTRVKDFEVFAKAVNLRTTSWKGPGFKQGPDHPVVNVSWQEAVAFCKWLTDKEHKDNLLPANEFYRLPTDLEWSMAVGLPPEAGKTPEMRDMGIQDVYPWGSQWPPPTGAGNYTGEETGSDVAIKGYDDGFAWTSPVGSFPPNKFGLYDMGGNVWQWCMDNWNSDSKAKVLRGASWYNGALKLSLLSSCRVHAAPDSSTDNYGFRIVRAKESPKSDKK